MLRQGKTLTEGTRSSSNQYNNYSVCRMSFPVRALRSLTPNHNPAPPWHVFTTWLWSHGLSSDIYTDNRLNHNFLCCLQGWHPDCCMFTKRSSHYDIWTFSFVHIHTWMYRVFIDTPVRNAPMISKLRGKQIAHLYTLYMHIHIVIS